MDQVPVPRRWAYVLKRVTPSALREAASATDRCARTVRCFDRAGSRSLSGMVKEAYVTVGQEPRTSRAWSDHPTTMDGRSWVTTLVATTASGGGVGVASARENGPWRRQAGSVVEIRALGMAALDCSKERLCPFAGGVSLSVHGWTVTASRAAPLVLVLLTTAHAWTCDVLAHRARDGKLWRVCVLHDSCRRCRPC